jgi:predicted anti-sigma-YlaC factor YlaD
MSCNDVQELMPQHVSGDLPSAQRERVDAHLVRCLTCSLWFEEVKELNSVWNQPTHPLPGTSFVAGVMQGIGVQEEPLSVPVATSSVKRRKTWTRTTLYHYGIAASCAILLMHFGVFQGFSTNAQVANALVSAKLEGLMAYATQLFY